MSTYAIGDIQGCFDSLQTLLDKIKFNPDHDKIWFAGDLVNRGPDSLRTLRFIKQLKDSAIIVLGNHDLHFLAVTEGYAKHTQDDNLDELLNAADLDELVDWLRIQPVFYHNEKLGFSMIHAGLPPQWDFTQTRQAANELEEILQSDNYIHFLKNMYGNKPDRWSASLQGMDRLRFITNSFTRLRYCSNDGELYLKEKGPIGTQSTGQPWFHVEDRASRNMKIIFGHWSTLGPYHEQGIYALDSGCLWGGKLTALRLEDETWFNVNCEPYRIIE
ncbi:MAG: symmetrical bis(5'-nucleosyl)-tetraphosphatase [Gammaproteobacteria bacterium]|nr:symmetrical bis(5'-nucleosyl)-tetraphosphatase [Gammaproteobacteria bacterium]